MGKLAHMPPDPKPKPQPKGKAKAKKPAHLAGFFNGDNDENITFVTSAMGS